MVLIELVVLCKATWGIVCEAKHQDRVSKHPPDVPNRCSGRLHPHTWESIPLTVHETCLPWPKSPVLIPIS